MTRPITTHAPGSIIGAGGNSVPLVVRYVYDAADPCAIVVRFLREGFPVIQWRFGRDLLAETLDDFMCHGDGDVALTRVYPDTLVIHIEGELDGKTHDATIATTTGAAEQILGQSYLLVPADTEFDGTDLDGELVRLLTEGAS